MCPNGKVQLLHLVKVARVVSGEKTKAERWPQELTVNIPSGYDNVNLNLSQASAQRHRRYFLLNNKAVKRLVF